jgi:hypothetical protein
MNMRKLLAPAITSVVLGTAASLAAAQVTPGGETGSHGHRHGNNPQWQACNKQAEDKKLARGPERRAFMKDCLKSAQGGSGQQGGSDQKPAG